MHIADIPGADQRVVMQGRARITTEFTVTIQLRERRGHHTVCCVWHPFTPSGWQIDEWSLKVLEAQAPYIKKAMQLGGLRVVGDA